MKRMSLPSVLLALAAMVVIPATVLATPSSGVTNNEAFQARGTAITNYTITTEPNKEIATQTLTFAPGATSGWHTHPGAVVNIVKSGTMTIWFSSDCVARTVSAGQAIVVPGGTVYDLARNNDPAVPLVLAQTYFNLSVLGPLRTEAPAPQCQPGAPADMGVTGITPTNHSRVRMGPAINITGAAYSDLVIQELTFAPGGTTGWHTHPGIVPVQVASGTLTFLHSSNCHATPYPAGTGFFDDPSLGVHLARNDGTAPTVIYATYTNLPVGGAPRIDAGTPACALAAATALPNTARSADLHGRPSVLLAGVALLLASLASFVYLSRRTTGRTT